MSDDLVKRLRSACNGHPHAKIPWPHLILHEAAHRIAALTEKTKRDSARVIALETYVLEAMKKLEADDMDGACNILEIAMCGRDD